MTQREEPQGPPPEEPATCPSCAETLPLHAFRCPESLAPRKFWDTSASLLFGNAGETVIPFLQGSFAKGYDRDLVGKRLLYHPSPSELHRLDPRELRATQPGIQRPAVEHYLGDRYEMWGLPYAEPHSAGNKYPVTYRYVHPTSGKAETMILSGHHRSTAALLQGQLVLARVIEGPVWRKGKS